MRKCFNVCTFTILNVVLFTVICAVQDEGNQLNTMELTESLKNVTFSTSHNPPQLRMRKQKKRTHWRYENVYSALITLFLVISGTTDLIAQQKVYDMVELASPISQFSTTQTLADFANSEQCTYQASNDYRDEFYDYLQGSCENKNYNCIVKDCDFSGNYKKGYAAHFLGNMFSLASDIITIPIFLTCAISPALSKCVSCIGNCVTVKRPA